MENLMQIMKEFTELRLERDNLLKEARDEKQHY